MKIWKTRIFLSWQKKMKFSDKILREAIMEINQGLIDADLGGGLIKKRIPKAGFGKRSGHRTIIATNKNDKWFFVHGFAKNAQENISSNELMGLKILADFLLNLTDKDINIAINTGKIAEVTLNEK